MHTTALEAALAYASIGWKVFPIRPSPNKQPLCKHGFREATGDVEQITSWWTRWPSAQIGVACSESDLVCFDQDLKVDKGVDGIAEMQALQFEHGAHDCVLEMRTPRKGLQFFYRMPTVLLARRLGVRRGIDVLGDGGYTIVPSPSSPGREWRVGEPTDELTIPPSWMLELADAASPKTSSNGLKLLPSARPVPLSDSQVADIRAALATIPNDERGVWLEVGFALKSTRAGQQAYDLWTAWSKATPTGATHPKFNEADQLRTWNASSELRLDGREVTIASLFWRARQHSYDNRPEEPMRIVIGAQPQPQAADVAIAPPVPPERLEPLDLGDEITLLPWEEVAQLPPIEWVVDELIAQRSLVVFAGNTEAGKSFALIDLAMRLVHGMPVYGREAQPCSVLYLAGEGHDGLGARFRAWEREHRHLIPAAGAHGRYCLVSDKIPLLTAAKMEKLNQIVAAVAQERGHAPGVLIIDTLSQAMLDDESDSAEVAPIVRGLAALRARWGMVVMLAHHLVKLNTKPRRGESPVIPGLDSIRGSGAITRNVDTVLGLVTLNETTGLRELYVWKQKDGSKLNPIRLWLQPVITNRQRSNGKEEWSCVVLPDLKLELGTKQEEKPPTPDAELLEDWKRIEAVLVEQKAWASEGGKGGLSRSVLQKLAHMKAKTTGDALEFAEREGFVVNSGRGNRGVWLLKKQPAAPPKKRGRK